MLEKLNKNRTRLFLAAYVSVVGHLSFMVWTFNHSDSIYQTILCGPPWIYETEEEFAKEFQLEFGKGSSETDFQTQEQGEGELGNSDAKDFAKGKYEGGKWEELLKDLESVSELRKDFRNTFEDLFPNNGVAESYIKRSRDYEDIIVKEVFPTLRTIRDPFRIDLEESEDNLAIHKERNRIIEEFRKGQDLGNPITMNLNLEGERPPKQPLVMGKTERIEYLDRNLKRTKERQLDEFINRFVGYDPNKGDLSQFVRDLYYENLQRLAYTFSGDITFFTIDYFQENLNKEDFLRQMMALLSQFQGTKTGTEILFTIENIYEIQNRALNLYFQNQPLYNTYSDEKKKEIRVETIRRVIEKYKPILKEKEIKNAYDAEVAFTKKRLEIMDTLVQTTPSGYRLKDAYFEKGRILWESGIQRNDDDMLSQAMATWKQIPKLPAEGDFLYEKAFLALEKILPSASGGRKLPREDLDQIDRIVRMRLSESLEKKKEREDRLLWPKVLPPETQNR